MCQSLFFNKVAGRRPAIIFKKSLWQRCFPVNFAKFLRTPFLQNTSGRLLLKLFGLKSVLISTVILVSLELYFALQFTLNSLIIKYRL